MVDRNLQLQAPRRQRPRMLLPRAPRFQPASRASPRRTVQVEPWAARRRRRPMTTMQNQSSDTKLLTASTTEAILVAFKFGDMQPSGGALSSLCLVSDMKLLEHENVQKSIYNNLSTYYVKPTYQSRFRARDQGRRYDWEGMPSSAGETMGSPLRWRGIVGAGWVIPKMDLGYRRVVQSHTSPTVSRVKGMLDLRC